jgi:hypothetical protein
LVSISIKEDVEQVITSVSPKFTLNLLDNALEIQPIPKDFSLLCFTREFTSIFKLFNFIGTNIIKNTLVQQKSKIFLTFF